jgi:hypothetical protein
MTIGEAIHNALHFLEANGYKGGDVHDDLQPALSRLKTKYPQIAREEL